MTAEKIQNFNNVTAEKIQNFKWYVWVDWKAKTNNHDRKYSRDQNLLKLFIETKNKVWDI
jgi:hypothetical protein